ncbi:DNase I-like protein, partial [Schizophyllum commune H4-8]|uniref:DNase I-like protein n=1 Tax=Schizophyllum commune (strain H4-8 / FGSC 9210) TaxID=578458 RepID=UPI002160CBFC
MRLQDENDTHITSTDRTEHDALTGTEDIAPIELNHQNPEPAEPLLNVPPGYRPRRAGNLHDSIQRKTTAGLRIASLNINGRGANSIMHIGHKWHDLWRLMKEQRINVIGLQETHLNNDYLPELQTFFKGKLKVFNSIEEDKPNEKGVAIVLNTRLTNTTDIEVHDIIPGRAIMVVLAWHGVLKHAILNTYAPATNAPDRRRFWIQLTQTMINKNLPAPDTHLGDHNMVEDGIDRLPYKAPRSQSCLQALHDFKNTFHLLDGWRELNPDSKMYTHEYTGGGRARLDRIHVTKATLERSHSWKSESVGSLTDHDLVSYVMTSDDVPFIGKGRWAIPLYLLTHRRLLDQICEKGNEMQLELERGQRGDWRSRSPQEAWVDFKEQTAKMARDLAKIALPKLEKDIGEWSARLKALENDTSLPDHDRQHAGALIRAKLSELYDTKNGRAKSKSAAADFVLGETLSAYWTKLNKDHRPREIMYRLRKRDTNEPSFVTKSVDMAELARDYHDNLQNEGMPENTDEWTDAIDNVKTYVKRRISADQKRQMAENLSEDQVRAAVKASPTNKAAGLDGIPSELWKALDRKRAAEKDKDIRTFDIIKCMTIVYNDIEKRGLQKGSKFAEGWMCPIYKKKAKDDIANYRPITVLNTDYKIFTKALSVKL